MCTKNAQAVVIRGKVYVGGGTTIKDDDTCIILQYSRSEDKWSTLPPAPVGWFGMIELNGQLVIVGGRTRQNAVTNKTHAFYDSTQKWEESISVPPMPTARDFPAVFSLPSCLVVVGGRDHLSRNLSAVEIFMFQTSQWHKASRAPNRLYYMTTTVVNNKCFLAECNSTKVYQLSVSLQPTNAGSSLNPQVITEWNSLPDLTYRYSALDSFKGRVLVFNPITTILSFSPITNTWKNFGDQPEPRCFSTTAILPTNEILVMGGGKEKSYATQPYNNSVWRAAIV